MKCQILLSRKNISSLSSAESGHSVVSVKAPITAVADDTLYFFFFFPEKIRLDITWESSNSADDSYEMLSYFLWKIIKCFLLRFLLSALMLRTLGKIFSRCHIETIF